VRHAALVAATVGLAACSHALPQEASERALVRDLVHIVQARDQVGWALDDLEVQAALPDAMASACRVRPEARAGALEWLDGHVQELGGPVEAAWRARGRKLAAVDELWLYDRTRLLLRTADDWARQGKCPFWLEPNGGFTGNQDYHRKLVLSLETGGRVYGQAEGRKTGFGGGGGGRLLGGYGITDRFTLMGGFEIGGAGRFTDVRTGERVSVPAVLLFAGVPVVARFHDISDHVDLEAGPIAYFNQLRGKVQVGGRAGVGVGVSRLVVRGILPSLTLSVTYDYIPAERGAPVVHQIGAGLRAGLSTAY